jgi:translocation and assembly module TamB
MLGGQGLADLAITGRAGTFTVQGPVRPGLLMSGPVERLAGPTTLVNLVHHLRESPRRFAPSCRQRRTGGGGRGPGRPRSESIRESAGGDAAAPAGAIAPNLRGRDLQLAMVVNGPFATPGVAYDLRAGSLTFGTTTVEGLRAVGSARVRADEIVIPVSAWASRILGMDAIAGGPVSNVRIEGEIGIAGTRLVSDNLRFAPTGLTPPLRSPSILPPAATSPPSRDG